MTDLYVKRLSGSLMTEGETARDLADFVSVWLRRSRDGNGVCRVWFDTDLIANGVSNNGRGQKLRYIN